jgi:deoxyribonucleoside regulator
MADDRRLKLLLNVARLFYVDKLTKTKIANMLQTSSTQISRLLREVEHERLVEFRLNPPRLNTLQENLIRRFECIREAVVVATSGDLRFQLSNLGAAAAVYFDEVVQSNQKVGISGGNTVYEMIRALPEKVRKIEIYPTALIGRGPFIPAHGDPMVLLNLLWEKSGRIPQSAYYATVPPFEKGSTPKSARVENEKLKKNSRIKEVWDGMHDVEILFASVGPVKRLSGDMTSGGTLLKLLSDLSITEGWLEAEGVLGDISYSLMDKEGRSQSPKWDFFITLGIEYLREMSAEYPRRRVVMIAGINKLEQLKAVLRGKLCNVLITDDLTAEALLS